MQEGVIEGIPGAGFVIQVMVIGGALTTAYVYLRQGRDPDFDVARVAALAAAAWLLAAVVIQLVFLVVE